MTTLGFFVDWNGQVRRTEQPGEGYTCSAIHKLECEGKPYEGVDIIDSEGFVVHAAVYYPTLDALRAVGVTVDEESV